jgi:PPOX class probable F420-dependent enzyme
MPSLPKRPGLRLPLPSPQSAFGVRVRERLRSEQVIWFTTVGADGTPQPNPVWFLWEEAASSLLVYNRPDAYRLSHIRRRPHVTLHFDGNGHGGDIVVLSGAAGLAPDEPAPHKHRGYLDKYRPAMIRVSGSAEAFSSSYPVAVRVEVRRVRGF